MRRRRLILLGSTGSIGASTLEVVDHLGERDLLHFEVVGLAAGANHEVLRAQSQRYKPQAVALADRAHADVVKHLAPLTFTGEDAALDLIESVALPGDLVVAAMVGSAGVPAVLAAIKRGCDIALANKETLVAAGELVMPAARKHDVKLLPVDSEHSAIFQCLRAGRSIDEVKRLVLTASGGPFRTWPREKIRSATVSEALNHPTWSMGRKITTDSASMMNKALEIIEAHHLFGLPAEKIDVLVHPQSIIHSMVEFIDGSVIAQLGPPDMKGPIQYALTSPERLDGCGRTMSWSEIRRLDFEPVDHDRFPLVALAHDVIRAGGTAGAVFNGANEEAVAAFLDERIAFGEIFDLVTDAAESISPKPVRSLDDVHAADQAARRHVAVRIPSTRPSPASAAT